MSEDKPAAPNNPYFMTPSAYGYGVPMRQSLFTAALWGAFAGSLVLGAAWLGLPIPEPFKIATIATVMATCITGLIVWPRYLERWMWIIESITHQDINSDGVVGKPQETVRSETVRVILTEDNGRQDTY